MGNRCGCSSKCPPRPDACQYIAGLRQQVFFVGNEYEAALTQTVGSLESAAGSIQDVITYDKQIFGLITESLRALECYGEQCGLCNVKSCKCRKLAKEIVDKNASTIVLEKEALKYINNALGLLSQVAQINLELQALDPLYQNCIKCNSCDCGCE